MTTVFISHRGVDAAEANRLGAALRDRGCDVWLDEWRINVGDSIVEKINEGLTQANFVLLCLSAAGVTAPWMSREWYSTLARQLNDEQVTLVPVRLTGGELPAVLADVRCADLTKEYDVGLRQILRVVGR